METTDIGTDKVRTDRKQEFCNYFLSFKFLQVGGKVTITFIALEIKIESVTDFYSMIQTWEGPVLSFSFPVSWPIIVPGDSLYTPNCLSTQ